MKAKYNVMLLLFGACVLLLATWLLHSRGPAVRHSALVPSAPTMVDDAPPPHAQSPLSEVIATQPPASAPPGDMDAPRQSAAIPSLPTGVVYRAARAVEGVAEVAHILETVSNAVTTVDGILKARNYRVVTQFDRPV